MECKSFEPQITKKSKILILGSMPGIKSLEASEYYAHPQNRFWKLMGKLCNAKELPALPYNKKVKILLDNGFALWDVLGFCKREGSLDLNIKDGIPNDIRMLLKEYPGIRTIGLNGGVPYKKFKKYFPEILRDEKYNIYKLPSTSPANAKFQLDRLFDSWRIILQ